MAHSLKIIALGCNETLASVDCCMQPQGTAHVHPRINMHIHTCTGQCLKFHPIPLTTVPAQKTIHPSKFCIQRHICEDNSTHKYVPGTHLTSILGVTPHVVVNIESPRKYKHLLHKKNNWHYILSQPKNYFL